MQYREQAIPLISFDPARQGTPLHLTTHRHIHLHTVYNINKEAEQIIASIDTPISVVSVAGLYRTGKSYLLNRLLLNRSSGFGVGSTINPCTKGLWMWGTPILTKSESGQPVSLILIDTEGLGALDEDQNHDTKIFSIAILLSNSFIYNSVGSIDQNAIQSLNLVLNLTENVYRKASTDGQEKLDYSEMPSFYWIVRDFSLELVNQKGIPITSKQYMESALALHKGTSKEAEEKNRIRKFITECFTNRDCFTLVKPLINETKLQNLTKIPFQELRPEFIEQVITVRKKIMGKLRQKTVNKKTLTGPSYVSLIRAYVEAINNGAVPNIQNAWDYLCLEQNSKVQVEIIQILENYIKDQVQPRIPTVEAEVCDLMQSIHTQLINHVKKNSYGENNLETNLQELADMIKTQTDRIVATNMKESISAAQNLIQKEYQPINKKLRSNLYSKFADFEADVNAFYMYMMERHRKYSNCELLYLEFINKKIFEGANYFNRNLEQEKETLATTKAEISMKNEKDINDLKTEFTRDRAQLTETINRLERERIETQFSVESLNKQLKDMTSKYQDLEVLHKKHSDHISYELECASKDFKFKEATLQEKIVSMERNALLKQAEWEKEKALYEQQVRFFKEKLEENERKERNMDSTLNSTKHSLEMKIKEAQNREELVSKKLASELQQKSEKLAELQFNFQKLQEDTRANEELSEKKEAKLKERVQQLERIVDRYKSDNNLEKSRMMTEWADDRKIISDKFEYEKQKNRSLEIQMKEINDQLKLTKVNLQKEKAIYTQKIQFQEFEIQELRGKFQQLQNTHQEALSNFENTLRMKQAEASNSVVFELRNAHEQQLRQMELDFSSKISKIKYQVDQAKRKREEAELALQIEKKNSQDKENEYRENLSRMEHMYERLQAEKLSTEKGTAELKREIELHYTIKIRNLENELDELRDRSRNELNDLHSKSERDLMEVKSYYQAEKERMEKRIQDEKERAERRLKKSLEDQEIRFREEQTQLEDEINGLKDHISELQAEHAQKISGMQYDFDMVQQKMQTEFLERKIELNKQISVLQQQNEYQVKKLEESAKEKDNLIMRYEDKIKAAREQALQEGREAVARSVEEKNQVEAKLEKSKKALKELENTLNKSKMDFEKEKTTLRERIITLQHKVTEVEERSSMERQLLEEQIHQIRETAKMEQTNLMREIERCKEEISRVQQEKNELIARYQNSEILLLGKLKFKEEQNKRYKDDYDDILSKFEMAVDQLSRDKTSLQEQISRIAQDVATTLQGQYERETEDLKKNHQRIVKDLQDRLNRVNAEKRSLNDKYIALEIKLNNSNTNPTSNSEIQRKYQREIERMKQEYQLKLSDLESRWQSENRDHKRTVEKLESRLMEAERRKLDSSNLSYMDLESKWSHNTHTNNKLYNNSPITMIPQNMPRESQSRRVLQPATSNKGGVATGPNSTNTLFSNMMAQNMRQSNLPQAQKPNKDRLFDVEFTPPQYSRRYD